MPSRSCSPVAARTSSLPLASHRTRIHSPVRCRRQRAHRPPSGHPPFRLGGCSDLVNAPVDGARRGAYRVLFRNWSFRCGAVSVCLWGISGTVNAAASLLSIRISRGHQQLLTDHLRDRVWNTSGSSPGSPLDPLAITSPITSANTSGSSSPVYQSCSPNINTRSSMLSALHLREYREARNPESKTEGKIKRCHLDFVGPRIAN
jgi:hypothetical protein